MIKTATGTAIRHIGPNHVHIDFNHIKSVGIVNILDVESHFINTIMNSKSHVIKFSNGGEVTFAYNANGALIDLSAKYVSLTISQADELVFFISPQ